MRPQVGQVGTRSGVRSAVSSITARPSNTANRNTRRGCTSSGGLLGGEGLCGNTDALWLGDLPAHLQHPLFLCILPPAMRDVRFITTCHAKPRFREQGKQGVVVGIKKWLRRRLPRRRIPPIPCIPSPLCRAPPSRRPPAGFNPAPSHRRRDAPGFAWAMAAVPSRRSDLVAQHGWRSWAGMTETRPLGGCLLAQRGPM